MSYDFLKRQAEAWLKRGPFSVVDKPELTASADPHDYVSLAAYWWQVGDSYQHRDGERNPEWRADKFDRYRLHGLINAVRVLTLAQQVFADSKYGHQAAELLRVWFIQPKSLMNPNLSYAQGVPDGESNRSGIIDIYEFWSMLDAVDLLIADGFLSTVEAQSLRSWFQALLTWLDQHSLGLLERNKQNNHGTSYDVQVIRYLLFTGDTTAASRELKSSIQCRLEKQILPHGRQPQEEPRTLSLHYHWYNLTKMCHLAELGARLGIDVLSHKNLIRIALEYLLPYVDRPEDWPLTQLEPVAAYNVMEPLFIGMEALDIPGCREAWDRNFSDRLEWRVFPLIPYRKLLGGVAIVCA